MPLRTLEALAFVLGWRLDPCEPLRDRQLPRCEKLPQNTSSESAHGSQAARDSADHIQVCRAGAQSTRICYENLSPEIGFTAQSNLHYLRHPLCQTKKHCRFAS